MTVTATLPRVQSTITSGNVEDLADDPTSVTFTVGFKYLTTAEIVATRTDGSTGADTGLTETTHYSISPSSGTSGTFTFTVAGAALFSADDLLTFTRKMEKTADTFDQLSDYAQNDALDADTLEGNFDKSIMISQQLGEEASRQIAFAPTATFDSSASEASTITGTKTARANKLLAFDSSGDIQADQEIGTWQGAWVSGRAYSVRDLIRLSDTGAVYICTSVHTAGTFATDVSAGNWSVVIDAGGFNVKLTGDFTIAADETYICPYKIDLNGYILENNGTLICAEIITGDGTFTGNSATESGPVSVGGASFVTPTGVQTLTNKTLTSPKINEDVVMSATATELNLLDGVSGLVQADFTKLAAIDATDSEIDTVADGTTSPGTNAVAGTDGIVTNDAGTMRQTTVDTFDTYLSQTSKTLENKKIPEIDSDSSITLDAETSVELNANNGIIYMKDDSATILTIQLSGGNTTITGP